MPKIERFTGPSGSIELDFVEREVTPQPLMQLSVHLHAAELSLPNTISTLDNSGVDRCRSTVHNWMEKVDLPPEDGKSPNLVAVDETMIQLNNERYWLLAAVAPETNEFLRIRFHPACAFALTKRCLREVREKHDAADALFLVDGALWLQAAFHRYSLQFHHETHGNRNAVE